MAASNPYQEFLRAKILGAIAEARAASGLTHAGVKGTVLEILVSRLFRPLLPADIGVGTGQIVEQYRGILSNQIDIILYDKSILPPALYDERTGIFPVEAVLYAIEVKTALDMAGLRAAHASSKKLNGFGYLPGQKNSDGSSRNHSIEKVRSVVFALSSTQAARSEAIRYETIYAAKSDPPFVRAICVVGQEYCYDSGEMWISMKPKHEYDEVLAFLGGVMNTYRSVAASRHSPLLGNYIIPDCPVTIGPVTRSVLLVPVKCEHCGLDARFKPNVGTNDITINGKIVSSDPCPKCGGKMESKEGHFVFKRGELQPPG